MPVAVLGVCEVDVAVAAGDDDVVEGVELAAKVVVYEDLRLGGWLAFEVSGQSSWRELWGGLDELVVL